MVSHHPLQQEQGTMIPLMIVSSVLTAAADEMTAGPVETVAEGFQFTEGPVWLRSGKLIFSDIPADTIYDAEKGVFRSPSGKSNGLTLDREGRLIACEHWNRRVTRTESDGSMTVLTERYEGKRFNSPNDVIVRSDGVIFFTDPPYGLEGRDAELDFSGVYALHQDGRLVLLFKHFNRPNGLAFSPDEKTLYVADSQDGFLKAYDVAEDGTLGGERPFAELPGPDGLKVDTNGLIWCTAGDGVRVYRPDGTHVSTVAVPERPANCAFGDSDGQTLYITARHGLYRVRCARPGILP
jgi:gluconolactonase